ncbi:pilus assembly protein PilM [Winslowiella toletana]|uniref:pilus assembly protein PilM n=1 Tax=Winslowiella toletana TaxID=92490 RepID=UPI0028BE2A5A|nr:pilus assembly protein PilM [Winslowiella toletana]WNN44645.1 pilus assembly protein PilM [Winslowiella toletana]
MAFQTWQIGLDIQNGQLCALGIQRRRNGWQLRHWWQHALPKDTLRNGALQRSAELTAVLQCWRKQLPRHISLRVGFPPQLVLQRQIDLPRQPLREPERNSYVRAAARRFFPIELDALALDYRESPDYPGQLCVTAARREMLEQWLACLAQAELLPQVFELTAAALRSLALALALDQAATLVHRLADHWLWFSPQDKQQPCGWCTLDDAADYRALRQRYLPAATVIYYSALEADSLPEGARDLLPLDALQLMQPPLPHSSGSFALAAGLALRPEDC